jgi:hypothetical protein
MLLDFIDRVLGQILVHLRDDAGFDIRVERNACDLEYRAGPKALRREIDRAAIRRALT